MICQINQPNLVSSYLQMIPTFFECTNLDGMEKIVNNELKKPNILLNVNRLALNITKTSFVLFSPE